MRRLRGGLDASTHAVDLVDADGTRRRLVVRRYTAAWSKPGAASENARRLAAVTDAGAPAPRVVAVDADGSVFGVQTLVMTRLPGRSVVEPSVGDWWLPGLATMLATIHTVPGHQVAALPDDETQLGEWLRNPGDRERDARGRAVFAALRAAARSALATGSPASLVHRDFHAGNVVFHRRRPSGVVDWDGAARGYPERDVGYCRLDLSLMAGGNAAEVFLLEYERASAKRVDNLAFWDLLGAAAALPDPARWLPSWIEWGRHDLTPALIRRRFTNFVHRAKERLGR